MKACIYGAGAIGGFVAVALHNAGCQVSLVDRGKQLAAIRERGLTLRCAGAEQVLQVPVYDSARYIPQPDYVFIAVKSWSVAEIIDDLAALLHERTALVSVNNGIPWWYFYGTDLPVGAHRLDSVDPQGRQWARFGAQRAIGCVVYPACRVVSPGVIEHVSGNRLALGEPGGEKSDRVRELAAALRAGGLKAPVKRDIRNEVWVKLLGNLAFNPISVLTGNTLREICDDASTRALARDMMLEAQAVGEALGAKFAIDVDQRIAGAAAVGDHKTSMLQDYEHGSQLELDALVTAVQELAHRVQLTTPTIDRVLASVREKLQSEGHGRSGSGGGV